MLLLVEGIQCTGGRYRQGVSIYRYPGPSASSLLVLANSRDTIASLGSSMTTLSLVLLATLSLPFYLLASMFLFTMTTRDSIDIDVPREDR